MYTVFHMQTEDDKLLLVPCLLRLQIVEEYRASPDAESKPQIQGALILQSLLRLPSSSSSSPVPVLSSFLSLPLPTRITIAHSPISSRILDVLLQSPTMPGKEKRRFLLSWTGAWEKLVDDRVGSRVGERCWGAADTYLKVCLCLP